MSESCVAQDFLPAATTLLAAFFGAWFAFRLQENHRKALEKAERVTAVNLAIYTISNAWNTLG